MAHTSEQSPKEAGQNSATTGASIAGANVPVAPAPAARSSQQQTPTTASSTSQHPEHEDKEYDPSAEALIDDIDDERTLEEEEALAGENSTAVQNELDDLKRESEMPIEELLAYYSRLREQEGAQEGDEEEEEEEMEDDDEEEDEDEDMDEEGEDEVRKKRSVGAGGGKNDSQSAQHSQKHQSATGDQTNRQPPSETALQTPPTQVNPSLSNSHLSSPPKPSQLNPQTSQKLSTPPPQQKCSVDLKETQVQDTQTRSPAVQLDCSQRMQQQDLVPQPPHIFQDQYRSSALPPAVQEQTLNIECLDDPQILMTRMDRPDAQPNDPSTPRHRRSMTEFLVDSGNASDSILKTFLDYDLDDSDDLDEDYSYTDDENVDEEREWRRVIHVGPEYQAEVPESLSEYENDLPPYENQDTLVWRCRVEQTKDDLMDYLKRASAIPRRNDISISPASVPKISNHEMRLYRERMQDIDGNKAAAAAKTSEINYENVANIPSESLRDVYMSQSRKRLRIDSELEQENAMDGMNQPYCDTVASEQTFQPARDETSSSASQDNRPGASTEEYFHGEEQLLYLLLQCNHNIEEALRRRHLDPFKYYIAEPMSLWSQDECLGFEHGLRTYGKNFFLIRETKVPTRSRAEVVAFYYLWKKSERHDVYTTQYKLDRKRSLTHPGTTDYMDKFIEDNESALNASSTHTPTPTESTVEANQISDAHHDGTAMLLAKCRMPDMPQQTAVPLQDPNQNNLTGPKDSSSSPMEDAAGGAQEGQIYLDGNTAI